MRQLKRALLAAAVAGAVATAAPAAAQTTTQETRKFTVVSVDGNKLVARDATGTREYTVPADFTFNVGGKQVGISEIRPGMSGTATITTTTTVTPVHVTEVRNGTVMQATGNSVIVRGPNGIRMFTPGDVAKRNITIMKDGKPVDFSSLHAGDRLSATIITEGEPKVMTEREVEATLGPAAAAAAPAAPTATATSGAAAGGGTAAGAGAAGGDASAGRRLPRTASDMPLLALAGSLALACGAALTLLRRRRDVR